MATENKRMQIKRDTAANWTSNDPTLLAGEFGFDTTNKLMKVGDGATAWTSLPYYFGNGLYILSTGEIGINKTNPGEKLVVNGAILISPSQASLTGRADAQIENHNNGSGHAMISSVMYQNPPNITNECAWSGQAYNSAIALTQIGAFYMRWQDTDSSTGYSVIGMHPNWDGGGTGQPMFEVFGDHGILMFGGSAATPPLDNYLQIKRGTSIPSIVGTTDLVIDANGVASTDSVFIQAYNDGNISMCLGGGSVGAGSVATPSAQMHIGDDATGLTTIAGTGALLLSSNTPAFYLYEIDASANNGCWQLVASGEQLVWNVANDAVDTANPFLTVDRTGTTVDSILLTATAIKATLAGSTGLAAVLYDSGTNEIFYDTSALKYKENIRENIDTSIIQKIKIKMYDRKDGSRKNEIGIIADELQEIMPELVCRNKDGEIEAVSKIDLIPYLVNEIQVMKKTYDEKILMLEKKIEEMGKRIEENACYEMKNKLCRVSNAKNS